MSDQPPRGPHVNKKLQKELLARIRECVSGERTHIKGEAVTHVGHIGDLHGTVCTCCPRRQDGAA